MNTIYKVVLNEEQRQHLEKLTSSGKVPARQMKRAQILLKSDVQTNWSYERLMEAFDHRLDGEGEAHLIALACGEPPSGRKRWSLRLLQDRFVKLGHVDEISYETIRRVLKKTNSNPG